jgi:hypothetical protein
MPVASTDAGASQTHQLRTITEAALPLLNKGLRWPSRSWLTLTRHPDTLQALRGLAALARPFLARALHLDSSSDKTGNQ